MKLISSCFETLTLEQQLTNEHPVDMHLNNARRPTMCDVEGLKGGDLLKIFPVKSISKVLSLIFDALIFHELVMGDRALSSISRIEHIKLPNSKLEGHP